MSKIEDFKEFVKSRPELVSYVSSGEASWQKLFETYDLYGDDNEIWNSFSKKEVKEETDSNSSLSIKNILTSLGNIDMESFQSNINSIQKAIGFFEELTRDGKKDKEKKVKKTQSYKTFDKFYSD